MKSLITIRTILFLTLISFIRLSDAQSKFNVSYSNKKDSTEYYIKNNTQDTINAVSINVNWFHMSDFLVFWPEDMSMGLKTKTESGSFTGKKYQFNFRSIQTMSFDFNILPGDSQRFATAVNYRNTEDTLMVGNLQMWYSTSTAESLSEIVYPQNTSDCDFAEYYLVANKGNDGVKKSTVSGPNLHPAVTCVNGLYAVVIDRNSLMPKPVQGLNPNCEDGMKWTTFGHATDDIVFYYFNPVDTSFESELIELIEQVQSGDHIFICSKGTGNEYNMGTDRLRKAWELIGGKTGNQQVNLNSADMFAAFGSKGNDAGSMVAFRKGRFNSTAYLELRVFLLPSQYPDIDISFAPCFEASTTEIKREQPKQNGRVNLETKAWRIFPNPISKQETLCIQHSFNKSTPLYIHEYSGRLINTFTIGPKTKWIDLKELPSGLYLLRMNGEIQKLFIQND